MLPHQRVKRAHAFDIILQLGQAGEHQRDLIAARADIANGVMQTADLRQQQAQPRGEFRILQAIFEDILAIAQRRFVGQQCRKQAVNRAQIVNMRRHHIGDDFDPQVVTE